LSKDCEPPPKESLTVGARKPSAQVPRTSMSLIGFHIRLALLLVVEPKFE